ncbi:hypothetical protein GCM10022252_41240 [Streptosporangium oxazolinicum]|uniref:GNAT family N-acetyltransferase n=1 Tax=Streptosporangium oxazolinicum TaxID=909287 RepID=A0ABP8B169_9ACTN
MSFDNGYDQGIGEWRGLVTGELTYARTLDGRPWLLFPRPRRPLATGRLVADPAAAGWVAEADARLAAPLDEAGDAFPPGEVLLAWLDPADDWNAQESALRGDRARLLPTPTR